MEDTNHERVGKILELFRGGLAPFVEREVRDTSKSQIRRLGKTKRNPTKRL